MKIVKFIEKFDLLIKMLAKQLKMKQKNKKGGFLNLLLGTLSASLLGNLSELKGVIRAGEGIIRAGQDLYCRLIP